jgi:hypothetical protein
MAQRTIEIEPTRSSAHLILFRSDLRAGRADAARARLEPLLATAQDPAQQRVFHGWLGRAHDAAGDRAAAVQAWISGQALLDNPPPLPRFEPPSAELLASIEAALAQPAQADPVNAPRLLWGAPGGGAERLVALLGGRTDGRVMIDRFGAQPRVDGFRLTQLGRRRASSPEQQAERFALEWRKGVSSFNAQPQDIDWLPHWDARLLPNLIRGLPDARVLVALRDPRDMLLNWMAFGTAQRHALVDPVEAARWLASALEQFLPLREGTRPSLHVVRMRELDNDAAQVAAEVAQFVGGSVPTLEDLQRARLGLGHLPTAFPAGHWRHYESVLGAAFALLEPVATRLGGD